MPPMIYLRRSLPPIFAVLFLNPAWAEKPEPPPWYEVEIIVFARSADYAGGTENWPIDPGKPDWEEARPLQPRLPQNLFDMESLEEELTWTVADAEPEVKTSEAETTALKENGEESEASPEAAETAREEELKMPTPFALLPESEFRLQPPAANLERTGGRLQPLLHLAWRQPINKEENARPLYIRSETADTFEVEGTLRININRYLHLNLDLLLYSQEEAAQTAEAPSLDGEFMAMVSIPSRTLYRMQAHRRMRSNELHYIDHPLMGALIQITPFKLPLPEKKEPTENSPQLR